MKTADFLIDQLRRAHDREAWHGPALAELIRDVTADDAARHPIPGLHSIWQIVLHVTAWTREVTRGLNGKRPTTPEEGDWPDVPEATETAWSAAVASLAEAHAELERTVGALPDDGWEQMLGEQGEQRDAPLGTGFSRRGLVVGLLQHDAYHGGQIALLKRSAASLPK